MIVDKFWLNRYRGADDELAMNFMPGAVLKRVQAVCI